MTYYRTCLEDVEISPNLKLEKGKKYLTSKIEDEKVTVFSHHWFEISANIFDEGKIFTKGEND
jgi:hypothetical protein